MICAAFNNWKRRRLRYYNTARTFAKSSTTLLVFTKYRKSAYLRPLPTPLFLRTPPPPNVVKIVLDPLCNKRPCLIVLDPLCNKRPCLIDAPYENYTKLLGISKKGENHSIHSVSLAWFTWGLSIFIFILWIEQRWKHNNPDGGFWHRRVRIWEER